MRTPEEQHGPPSESSNRRVCYEENAVDCFGFGSFLPPIFPRKNFRGIFRPGGRDCGAPARAPRRAARDICAVGPLKDRQFFVPAAPRRPWFGPVGRAALAGAGFVRRSGAYPRRRGRIFASELQWESSFCFIDAIARTLRKRRIGGRAGFRAHGPVGGRMERTAILLRQSVIICARVPFREEIFPPLRRVRVAEEESQNKALTTCRPVSNLNHTPPFPTVNA
ncbi:hypothetical protein JOF39_000623 [Glutamicibacter protophormiae]|uniref:Uncharacterized protein n=1 Tax=Glutamicibacter protophormiae TaxID=37930 RepID=A0ABS4XMP7_GLUPR|nr:hypothetical protein [Glutamicibacter protophormiae]